MNSVYLVEGTRTPFGSFGGSLKAVPDIEPGVIASKEAIKRSNIPANDIEHVFFGNMSRGKHFNHKEKGHPGNFPSNSVSEGKNNIQCGKPIENIIPQEAFKNRVTE